MSEKDVLSEKVDAIKLDDDRTMEDIRKGREPLVADMEDIKKGRESLIADLEKLLKKQREDQSKAGGPSFPSYRIIF
jgi:hypothetical protein